MHAPSNYVGFTYDEHRKDWICRRRRRDRYHWLPKVVDSLETNAKAQNSSTFCNHFVCGSVAHRSIHPNSTNYIHEIWLYIFTKLMAVTRRLSASIAPKKKRNTSKTRNGEKGVRTTFLCFGRLSHADRLHLSKMWTFRVGARVNAKFVRRKKYT